MPHHGFALWLIVGSPSEEFNPYKRVYMNAAVEQLRAEGRIDRNIELGHLSPALYGHINPYGKYRFEIEGRPDGLRPLRSPGKDP